MRYPSALAALVTLGAAVGGLQPAAAQTAEYAFIGTYTRDAREAIRARRSPRASTSPRSGRRAASS